MTTTTIKNAPIFAGSERMRHRANRDIKYYFPYLRQLGKTKYLRRAWKTRTQAGKYAERVRTRFIKIQSVKDKGDQDES